MRLRPGLTAETEEGADVATWRVEIEVETENDGVQKKAILARMDCCEKKKTKAGEWATLHGEEEQRPGFQT